jgi:hypothetical protein
VILSQTVGDLVANRQSDRRISIIDHDRTDAARSFPADRLGQAARLRDLPDTLPGRMETIERWPFSQGEIDRTPDSFVDAAFPNCASRNLGTRTTATPTLIFTDSAIAADLFAMDARTLRRPGAPLGPLLDQRTVATGPGVPRCGHRTSR